jgi:uncharacterized membrane protein
MAANSRIRFNPVTKEIEIEGSEQFVKASFDRIQQILAGSKEEKTKEPSARKSPLRKRSPKPDRKQSGRGAITAAIMDVIKESREGISTAELKKKTGFNQKQIWPVIKKAEKTGIIKRPKRGVYVFSR